jgi:hypothetical protein
MTNPWVGLRPFETSESSLFYGRDSEARILTNLVATLPILVVYAPSGTGKSSLINAGLAPELMNDPAGVPIVNIDPSADVVVQARQELASPDGSLPDRMDLAELLEEHSRNTSRRAVVVMDQFEEGLNAGVPMGELFASIARLAHSGSDAACVIISIREDYLGGLEPLMRRVPGLLDASYRVPALSREALEAAVYGPIRESGESVSVEDQLVTEVLDDLGRRSSQRQEPGEQRFEPGYFQIIWSTLWDETASRADSSLTLRRYRDLGGAERILKDFTAKILDQLEPARRQMFWAMARYMVLPTGAKTALTVEDLTELLQPTDYLDVEASGYEARSWLAKLPPDERAAMVRVVLTDLTSSGAPLLQRVIRSDREEFELLHDLLGRILLDWRSEYEEAYQAEAARRLQFATRRAEEELDARGFRRGAPRYVTKAKQVMVTGTEEADALHRRIGESPPDVLARSATEDIDEMLVRRAMIATLRRNMDFDDYYATARQWDAASRRLGNALVMRALHDPSPDARRAAQEQIPVWAETSLEPYVPMRSAVRAVATRLVVGTAMAAVSVGLAFLFVRGVTDDLELTYVGLTMAQVLLLFILLYFMTFTVNIAGSSTIRSRLPAFRKAFVPASYEPKLRRRLIMLPATWPLPALLAGAGGVLGALLFDAAGWAPTAGFNLGILYAAPGMALLTGWASEEAEPI